MQFTLLEDFIYNLYQSMKITAPSEIDIFSIANWFNIKLRFWDESSEAVEKNGTYWVFINDKLNCSEQWEDFSHELCHVLQHEGYQQNIPIDFYLYQELKADNFMYHFCIPTFMLQEYQISNYYNIEDGISTISKDFNVTKSFARKRLIQYKNKIQQSKSDEEHRNFMQSLYPKAPPYSHETMKVMEKLSAILYKKGLN